MEIREFKTTNVRGGIKRPYQSPTTSVLALDYLEGVLVVLSYNNGHDKDNYAVKEQDPDSDDDGRTAKSFSVQFEELWADDTEDDE